MLALGSLHVALLTHLDNVGRELALRKFAWNVAVYLFQLLYRLFNIHHVGEVITVYVLSKTVRHLQA